jgi:hypothetical protein
MEKNLQMSLKRKWFEMTENGIKTEDYREITPYWCNRFLYQNGKKQSKEWWGKYLNFYRKYDLEKAIKEKNEKHRLSFVEFENNIMTLGYPKSGDSERILKLEHAGIEIKTGNPDWGAEPNKLYFVIKHGEIINN